MRAYSFAAAAVLAAASVLPAQTPDRRLTLEEAVALALRDAPEITIATARAGQAEARLRQARSTWLPQLRVAETWTDGDNPVYVFGTLLEQGRFGPEHFDPAFLNAPPSLENYRTAVSVQAPVFDQLRRIGRIGQAELGLRAAGAAVDGARQQMIFETLRLYDGVVLAEEQKRVADEAVRAAEADVTRMRDMEATGLIVRSDLLAAEVQLAEFVQRQIEAGGNVVIARAALASLLGLPDADLELASALPEPPASGIPLETLLAEAEAGRADLIASESASRAARLETRIARGSWLPRIDAFATFGSSGTSFGGGSDDTLYGATVSLDVLQPGRWGRVAEARAGELEAAADAERLRRNARVEILSAHTRLTAARRSVEVAEQNVGRAEEALRVVRDRYAEGLTTITEQLRAQTALLGARLQLHAARSAARVSHAGLLLASGRLDSLDPILGGTE